MRESLQELPVNLSHIAAEQVVDESFDEHTPAVIAGAMTRATGKWTDDWLLRRFGDGHCEVSLDSRTARTVNNKRMPLGVYLDTLDPSRIGAAEQSYLFHSQRDFEGARDLLDDLDVPEPILALGGPSMYRFFVGPPLTGTLPHLHTSAINALARGRKRWAIYAGPTAEANRALVRASLAYETGAQASDWFTAEVPGLRRHPRVRLWEFVQEGGDLVYIPSGFVHAVVNLEQVAGFTVEFGGPPGAA
jgi:hypothetical protein